MPPLPHNQAEALTMTVTQHMPGVWTVECERCGVVAAYLYLEHDRACQLAYHHNHS